MTIFIFEHLCGGGMPGQPFPPDLAAQGGAMLAAVCGDFINAGHHVVCIVDTRCSLTFPGVEMREAVTPLEATFDQLAADADIALIIAPESGDILVNWLIRLERLGVRHLGCTSAAARLCGDKLAMGAHLAKQGVPTPALLDNPSFPCVVKPRFGVGCEETWLCRNTDALAALPSQTGMIVQPYVPGVAASVSLLLHGPTVIVLPAGRQIIEMDDQQRLHYRGGVMPLSPVLHERAAALGVAAARSVPGLHGFVGVDLVLGESMADDVIIEINPRLTMSYVGLQYLCRTNLAAAMLDAGAPLRWSGATIAFDAQGRMMEAVST